MQVDARGYFKNQNQEVEREFVYTGIIYFIAYHKVKAKSTNTSNPDIFSETTSDFPSQ